jgi:heptosyltransferase III
MSTLFITSNPLGDAILSSGAIPWLAGKFPGEKIVVVCSSVAAPLFRSMPEVEEVWPMDKRPRGAHWWQLWRRAVGRRWRYVLDLRGSATAYFLWSRGRKVTPAPDGRMRHRILHLTDTLGASEPLSPRLCINAPDFADAKARFDGAEQKLLFIGSTARWMGKVWPAEHYAELVRSLTGPTGLLAGAKVVIAGAPGEEKMAEPILNALPEGQAVLAIGWPLMTVAAAIAQAEIYIGNDTGLMHLSAAVGAPTLGLFGPSRPEHYAPWGSVTSFVRSAVPYETIAATPGFPDPYCDSLLADIPVEKVVDAATALMQKRDEIALKEG